MTDKIIIDGCDVSGCIHRATNKIANDIGTYCRCFTESCQNIKNCHYKQLKRAEQECERLKRQYNCYACDTCNGKEDYINLKRHCENAIKSLHSKQASYETMQVEWNEAKNEVKKLKKENEELKKQACGLRPEIKYIINEICCKYNINAKYYHEKIVEIINNLDQLKQVLQEIKKIAQYNVYTPHTDLCIKLNWIKKKISEVEK